MAGHHHLHAGPGGFQVELCEVVDHVQADLAEAEELRLPQPHRPRPPIVVAAPRRDGRERGQRLEDAGIADVACVDDVVAAVEEGLDLRPQQAVGVGDQADAHVRAPDGGQASPAAKIRRIGVAPCIVMSG